MTFTVERVIPILRIFDKQRAHEFYVGYLGCTQDWIHNPDGPGPSYQQVSRGGLVLHLSERHGDGTPGTTIYVAATGLRDLHAELHATDYHFLYPGIDPSPGREDGISLNLGDPFNNTLRLVERPASLAGRCGPNCRGPGSDEHCSGATWSPTTLPDDPS